MKGKVSRLAKVKIYALASVVILWLFTPNSLISLCKTPCEEFIKLYRDVGTGDFDRSVNPILTSWGETDYAHPISTLPPTVC